jgi:uncharacterized protein (TIGR03067 family)
MGRMSSLNEIGGGSMMKSYAGLCPLLLLAVVGGNDKAQSKGPIDGSWVPVSLTVDGTEKQVNKDEVWAISGDKLSISIKGKKRFTMSLKFDTKNKPAALDLAFTAPITLGPLHGIYRVEGGTLTICRTNDTAIARPKEFKSTPGSKLTLEVYTRKK